MLARLFLETIPKRINNFVNPDDERPYQPAPPCPIWRLPFGYYVMSPNRPSPRGCFANCSSKPPPYRGPSRFTIDDYPSGTMSCRRCGGWRLVAASAHTRSDGWRKRNEYFGLKARFTSRVSSLYRHQKSTRRIDLAFDPEEQIPFGNMGMPSEGFCDLPELSRSRQRRRIEAN